MKSVLAVFLTMANNFENTCVVNTFECDCRFYCLKPEQKGEKKKSLVRKFSKILLKFCRSKIVIASPGLEIESFIR